MNTDHTCREYRVNNVLVELLNAAYDKTVAAHGAGGYRNAIYDPLWCHTFTEAVFLKMPDRLQTNSGVWATRWKTFVHVPVNERGACPLPTTYDFSAILQHELCKEIGQLAWLPLSLSGSQSDTKQAPRVPAVLYLQAAAWETTASRDQCETTHTPEVPNHKSTVKW